MANKRTLILAGYIIAAIAISCFLPQYMGLMLFGFFVVLGWLQYSARQEKQNTDEENEKAFQ